MGGSSNKRMEGPARGTSNMTEPLDPATAALGEPVGASVIAWLVPAIHEVPSVTTVVGGGLVLVGIGLALGVGSPGPSARGQPLVGDSSASADPGAMPRGYGTGGGDAR